MQLFYVRADICGGLRTQCRSAKGGEMTEVGVAEGLLNAQRSPSTDARVSSSCRRCSTQPRWPCSTTSASPPRPRAGGLIGEATDDESLAGRFKYHNDERYSAMWSNAFDLRLRFGVVADIVARLADVARALLVTTT